MNRDPIKFPNDENGEVLWELSKRGVEVGGDREVQFALLFPEPDAALKFGVHLLRHGYWVQVNEIDDRPGYKGEVLAKIYLGFNHKEITEAEAWLAERSSSLGGKNDGWQVGEPAPEGEPEMEFVELPPHLQK